MFSFISLIASFSLFLISFFYSILSNSAQHLPYLSLSLFSLIVLALVFKTIIETYLPPQHSDQNRIFLFSITTSLITILYYAIVVYGRTFSYTSDHAVYFNQQQELLNLFHLSPLKGVAGIILSMWRSDYSYFINLLLALPFYFTSHTNEAFVITYSIVFLVPACFSMNLLISSICRKHYYSLSEVNLFTFLCNWLYLTFPLLHFASLLGMPDLFGITFIFFILLILINQDFSSFHLPTSITLAFLIVCLIVTRRWYLFFLIGFLPIFFISSYLRDPRSIVLKNEAKMIACIVIFTLITLLPFIYRTLFIRNYADEYSAWYIGGLPYELHNQACYLGLLFLLLLIIGVFYGIVRPSLRPITIVIVLGGLISLYSFTRIQNMGKHQILCVVPYYLLLLWNCFHAITQIKSKLLRSACVLIILIITLANNIAVFTQPYRYEQFGLTTHYSFTKHFQWK